MNTKKLLQTFLIAGAIGSFLHMSGLDKMIIESLAQVHKKEKPEWDLSKIIDVEVIEEK